MQGKDGRCGEMESNSERKLKVELEYIPKWDKTWVKVTLLNEKARSFYPSFEDLYRIVTEICRCEDFKYGNLPGVESRAKGSKMVGEFLHDCCLGIPYDELAIKYKLPKRSYGGYDEK
jgi:hypothetical protein